MRCCWQECIFGCSAPACNGDSAAAAGLTAGTIAGIAVASVVVVALAAGGFVRWRKLNAADKVVSV